MILRHCKALFYVKAKYDYYFCFYFMNTTGSLPHNKDTSE